MTEETILRPLLVRVITVAAVVMAVLVVGSLLLQGSTAAAASASPAALLGVYVAWLLFWQPSVGIGPAGVRLHNPFRSIEIPWGAILRVDTRFALTVYTGSGAHVAWAAPSPGRHSFAAPSDTRHLPKSAYVAGTVRPGDVPGTQSGDAATIIRRELEQRQRGPAMPDEPVQVRTHRMRIAVLGVLVAASGAALLGT